MNVMMAGEAASQHLTLQSRRLPLPAMLQYLCLRECRERQNPSHQPLFPRGFALLSYGARTHVQAAMMRVFCLLSFSARRCPCQR
jgi:hypothetical protein